MCTAVFIREPGREIDIECDSIRDLARHFSDLVPSKSYVNLGKINRMSETCLCQVDVEASAKASGWDIIDYEPATWWWTVTKSTNSH